MKRTVGFSLLSVLIVAIASPRVGEAKPRVDPLVGDRAPQVSDFWRKPSSRQADAADLAKGLALLRRATQPGTLARTLFWSRRIHLVRARMLFRRLVSKRPNSAERWYWLGYVANLLKDAKTTILAWERVWKLDPHYGDTPDMAFTLGVLYSKQGQYQKSANVYKIGLPATPDLSLRGIMASNSAESYMALGKLNRAVDLYRLSLQLRPKSNSAAWWGLAVAYDRLGRTRASTRATQRALQIDPTLRGLLGKGVFFVPDGDVHYYLALAHEEQGKAREALEQWEKFLRAQPRGPWVKRARDHRARLQRLIATFRPAASIAAVVPGQARPIAGRLLSIVDKCYRQRGQRRPIPEGNLTVLVALRGGRVTLLSPMRTGDITDAAIWRCLRAKAMWQRLGRPSEVSRFAVTYRLELTP